MKIIWKEIEGFSDYKISNHGDIMSVKTQRTLSPFFQKTSNHFKINLYVEGDSVQLAMHRLVAKHFVENPNNYSFIRYKDGNHKNIKASNLVWVKNQKLCQ